MPENTLRLASPMSSVRRSSLSAPSTNSHFLDQRDAQVHGGKGVEGDFGGDRVFGQLAIAARLDWRFRWLARSSLDDSIMASIFAGSIRVNSKG
jgi:hypothetical protein